ncbi:hypothetical protein RRG08_012096 [Elysia crispata]|uniref:Uncharacterized protein n=1 Tax=Elysia crispata TaxID=231223 RepID=A0AAE1A7P3_9GAST|nr:hypothetical protein RRG08_012096 [Elysia crispata]
MVDLSELTDKISRPSEPRLPAAGSDLGVPQNEQRRRSPRARQAGSFTPVHGFISSSIAPDSIYALELD